jgi:hypothetical protein
MRQTKCAVVPVLAMKPYEGWEGYFHSLFILELDRVSGWIDVPIALSPTKGPRCLLNWGLVGSESCVDVLERIKSAAFARNPRCRRGMAVKLHKDCPLIIDRGD